MSVKINLHDVLVDGNIKLNLVHDMFEPKEHGYSKKHETNTLELMDWSKEPHEQNTNSINLYGKLYKY